MHDHPIRIQLRRTKGWRMPPNTVVVARGPGRIFGNPFTIKDAIEVARVRQGQAPAFVVACFRIWLAGGRADWMGQESDDAAKRILDAIPTLRGKHLACFCPLDQPCHADVLLEIANE